MAYEVGGFLRPLGLWCGLYCVVGASDVVKVADENNKSKSPKVQNSRRQNDRVRGEKHGQTIRVTMRKERPTKSRVLSAKSLGL